MAELRPIFSLVNEEIARLKWSEVFISCAGGGKGELALVLALESRQYKKGRGEGQGKERQ